MAQVYRVAATFDSWEKKNSLLDRGCQQPQVHNLSDPSAGDMAQPGQFGVVGDLARLYKPLETDGQCHELRNARYPAGRMLGYRRLTFAHFLSAAPIATAEVDRGFN